MRLDKNKLNLEQNDSFDNSQFDDLIAKFNKIQ